MKYDFSIFRGDTLNKTLKVSQNLSVGDKAKYAVMLTKNDEEYLYSNEITIDQTTKEVDLNISPTVTAEFPIETLLFEVEVTYSGIVKTKQWYMKVLEDGINERA